MALVSKEVDYQLATLDAEGPWCDWVRSLGRQPLVLGDVSRGHLGSIFYALWRFVQYVRQNSVDVIYVCGTRAAFILRFLRIFFTKIKLVHGVRWNPNSDSRLDRFFRQMERITYPLVDAWITNSAIARQTLITRCRIPNERIFVIYNGLESMPKDNPSLNERPIEVLTVANLNPRKGHREYLQAVREIVKVIPNARFTFVGRDDMNGEIQRTIAELKLDEFVRYKGFQANVSLWYRRARLFVLPSLWGEGCPTCIIEAMSYGLPIVAYMVDGIPEIVTTEKEGVLVEKIGDYEGLVEAILRVIGDEKLTKTLSHNSYNRAKKEFNINVTIDKHKNCFNTLITQPEKNRRGIL